jgi:F0F1-type ATP synthase membrane subunit b/b'
MKTMKKLLTSLLFFVLIFSLFTVCAYALDGDATAIEGSRAENFYTAVYQTCKRHADKILSALAALGSLILAFTYKKGLMPTLKSAIEKLCDAVSKIKTSSKEQSEKAEELLALASDKLIAAKDAVELISQRLEKLEQELNESLEGKEEREKQKKILIMQTEMLYDIFMTSALPQYQKDMVGEKTAKMKEEIIGGK